MIPKGLVAASFFVATTLPASADGAPKGMVAAYGKIDSDAGPIAELSGFVPENACHIRIPPMWRPDKGYVRFSYRCTK
jgi:hypothetical protein